MSDGSFSYRYDAEGNLSARTNRVTGALTIYAYDHRNRLLAVTDRDPGGLVIQSVEFAYDAMNRRLSRKVDGQVTRFLYNQDDSWVDLDSANAISARYLLGAKVDELLARQRPGDRRGWYLTDHLGTVRGVADAQGQLMARQDYSSFGGLLGGSNLASLDRFHFTGREFDENTGIYFYRARYFHPVRGSFLTQDPLVFASGLNLYRYAANNPLSNVDPTGLADAPAEGTFASAISSAWRYATKSVVCQVGVALVVSALAGDIGPVGDVMEGIERRRATAEACAR